MSGFTSVQHYFVFNIVEKKGFKCQAIPKQAVKIQDLKYQLTSSAVLDIEEKLGQVSQLSDSAPDD